jgi:micrococcal nuclease
MDDLYQYKAELIEVVDGDTYDFWVDLGFESFKRVRVRLLGLDTHEIYGTEKSSAEYRHGLEEKRFAEEQLSEADEIYLRTYKNDETGKYGRYLAEVYVDGDDVKELLTEQFDRLPNE